MALALPPLGIVAAALAVARPARVAVEVPLMRGLHWKSAASTGVAASVDERASDERPRTATGDEERRKLLLFIVINEMRLEIWI
ncbi:MAG TPA: hypothetical protein VFP68_03155 [Burkholderiaceae bacterium]|nr:hypothetical protein [Burkholderiaceae bacterium]